MLRKLTVDLYTSCAYDLSSCTGLRELNLTLWKVGTLPR